MMMMMTTLYSAQKSYYTLAVIPQNPSAHSQIPNTHLCHKTRYFRPFPFPTQPRGAALQNPVRGSGERCEFLVR